MRHRVAGRRLSRDTNARKALLGNLASSLLVKEAIVTTLAKAKFVKPFVEKLITDAKKNKLAANRYLASFLSKDAFSKLTLEIGPGFAQRHGGYTRIIKLNTRHGDSAPFARIELLQREKPRQTPKAPKRTASRKTRPQVSRLKSKNEKIKIPKRK